MIHLTTLVHLRWRDLHFFPRLEKPEVRPRPDLGKDVWEVLLGKERRGFVTSHGPLRVEEDGTISVLCDTGSILGSAEITPAEDKPGL
jgi:hypothetical protein